MVPVTGDGRGRLQLLRDQSLLGFNTFRFAVRTRYLAQAGDLEAVRESLAFARQRQLPLLVLGGGSNLVLVDDFPGLTLRVELPGLVCVGEDEHGYLVRVGAGMPWPELVQETLQRGYYGLENLSLIPGTAGAAPIQNIGAYGVELKDRLVSLEALHIDSGECCTLTREECGFGYRDSVFKGRYRGQFVILSLLLRLDKQPRLQTAYGAIEQELERMGVTEPTPYDVSAAVCRIRRSKLPDPRQLGNAGSFFKNPRISRAAFTELQARFPDIVGYPEGQGSMKVAAGWLIERCGWKGARRGDAGVHERQALVLVNHGQACGRDILALAEAIQDSVWQRFNIRLEPEPVIVTAD